MREFPRTGSWTMTTLFWRPSPLRPHAVFPLLASNRYPAAPVSTHPSAASLAGPTTATQHTNKRTRLILFSQVLPYLLIALRSLHRVDYRLVVAGELHQLPLCLSETFVAEQRHSFQIFTHLLNRRKPPHFKTLHRHLHFIVIFLTQRGQLLGQFVHFFAQSQQRLALRPQGNLVNSRGHFRLHFFARIRHREFRRRFNLFVHPRFQRRRHLRRHLLGDLCLQCRHIDLRLRKAGGRKSRCHEQSRRGRPLHHRLKSACARLQRNFRWHFHSPHIQRIHRAAKFLFLLAARRAVLH